MTKEGLMENCTFEQIAEMCIEKQRLINKLNDKYRCLRSRCHESARDNFDRGLFGILHIVGEEELKVQAKTCLIKLQNLRKWVGIWVLRRRLSRLEYRRRIS